MRMQNYDEKLSFALTGDLDVIRGTNDDGVPTFAIGTGKSVDNEGTESLTWQVNVSSGNRGENLGEQASGITLNGGDLKVTVRFLATSRNFLGMELTINTCLIFLFHPEKLYILNSVCVGNADRQTQWLEAIDQVLAAIRLDGKSGNFRKLTLQDLDASANENLAFPGATPGENQHSHLDFLERSRGALSMFGGMVQMNQSGTEYSFQSLDAYDEDEDTAKANIIAADKGGFALADTALKMGELFRVDASVFNANEDREQEIQNGLVRRCAMYEAFRSFAWTLAAYCDKESLTPEAVPAETLEDIASFVVDDRNRLNYVSDSFCPTICSGDDIHNYYIPDGTPAAAREELIASMGDEEDKDPAARILSLEGLRKDLTYLYPAMQTIYDSLAARRDVMEALEGSLPEVLYVWCAMTYAAREPIYTEDGPMTCWWSHPGAPAKLLPPQKNVQPAEKKAPDAGYHFTYDKGLTYEDSKFIFNYPDN
ncbi:MAG: hypothetical protein J6Q54_05855, partial [Oscillospiraceae bacterium]|nr:hypothetical protein [Oscillospiraceae bacterium]